MQDTDYIIYCETIGVDFDNEIARDIFNMSSTLNQAVESYLSLMDGCATTTPTTSNTNITNTSHTSNSSNKNATVAYQEEDIVRAPLPQKVEALVGSPSSANHEYQVRSKDYRFAGSKVENNFLPPIDLITKGDMGIGKEEAILQEKWLVVNIQDKKEFVSMLINRDIWKRNSTIWNLISKSCIFQQHEVSSVDGHFFLQHFGVKDIPAIAFLDPVTLNCELLIDSILFDEVKKKRQLIVQIENFLTKNIKPPSFRTEETVTYSSSMQNIAKNQSIYETPSSSSSNPKTVLPTQTHIATFADDDGDEALLAAIEASFETHQSTLEVAKQHQHQQAGSNDISAGKRTIDQVSNAQDEKNEQDKLLEQRKYAKHQHETEKEKVTFDNTPVTTVQNEITETCSFPMNLLKNKNPEASQITPNHTKILFMGSETRFHGIFEKNKTTIGDLYTFCVHKLHTLNQDHKTVPKFDLINRLSRKRMSYDDSKDATIMTEKLLSGAVMIEYTSST